MKPRVVDVVANDDYTLNITFTNGEKRVFDAKSYLTGGIFEELNDTRLFKTVKPWAGTIQWIHEQDLCPDSLYLESVPL